MVERDEEGRPKATRNAGAFLGPSTGMIPVPTEALDRYWRDRRAGPRRRRRRALWVVVLVIAAIVLFLVLFALTPPGPMPLAG